MDVKFQRRLIVSIIINQLIFGMFLFLPAGTLQWPRAWLLLGLIFIGTVVSMVWVHRRNPAVLDQRFKSPLQQGQPWEDKVIVSLFIGSFIGLLLFIPLDRFRFQVMPRPVPVVSAMGLWLFVMSWWVITQALAENPFASPAVEVQQQIGQTVVKTGVYAIVRHPMYAGTALLLVGICLWLESYASTLLASVPIGLLALRIVGEERFLRHDLVGYDNYVSTVRYRLIPWVW